MDFHTYYLRRLENRPDQVSAMNSCRDMALKLLDSGPLTWSIESGAALLTALHEAKLKPEIDPLPVFEAVEQALATEIQGVRLDLEADRELKIRSTGCCKRPVENRTHRRRKER